MISSLMYRWMGSQSLGEILFPSFETELSFWKYWGFIVSGEPGVVFRKQKTVNGKPPYRLQPTPNTQLLARWPAVPILPCEATLLKERWNMIWVVRRG
jgi:hypothetical protein